MSGAGPVAVACAARSETGERERNEDRALVRVDGARVLALVADGAGGHARGAEASRRAAARIEAALDGAPVAFTHAVLEAAVQAAHADVRQGAAADGTDAMHTTLVVLWIDGDAGTFLWASVGDSRLYRVRDGVAKRLSPDDSVVQRLVDAGMLSEAMARVHPQRNQLVAALGIDDALEPHGPAAPEPLRADDAFLLCSDGWWGAFDDAAIAELHGRVASPDAWLDAMEHELRARRDPRQDNYTAVAVWVAGAAADAADAADAPSGDTTRPMTTL